MGKKRDLTASEKKAVINCRSYFLMEKALLKRTISDGTSADTIVKCIKRRTNRFNSRTSEALRISERSVSRVYTEKHETGAVSKSKKSLSGRRRTVVDSFTEGVIRRQFMQFYQEKQYPTIKKALEILLTDPNFPRMCSETLRKILKKQLKFRFVKFHGKPVPFERDDIAAHRCSYLQSIRKFRREGYSIFYQDESWTNSNQGLGSGWHMPSKEVLTMNNTARHTDVWLKGVGKRFADNLIGGISSKPSGAGKRVIIINMGSETGFLKCGKAFIAKKNEADYHASMNAAHFEAWFEEVLNEVPNNSVLVLDQASYHRRVTPETVNPTTKWRKPEVIQWMIQHKIPLPEQFDNYQQMTLPLLRNHCKKFALIKQYVVEKMVETCNKNIKILWLPVAHCELNPIELIWSQVKRHVSLENKTFKIQDVLQLTQEAVTRVTPNAWQKCIEHVKNLEQLFVDADKIVDLFQSRVPERIIIDLNEESSESDQSDTGSNESGTDSTESGTDSTESGTDSTESGTDSTESDSD